MLPPLPQKKHSPSLWRHRLKQPVRKRFVAVNEENIELKVVPLERQIGNTTYIVTAECNSAARASLAHHRRLLLIRKE
jgi:hypothetical protein